MRAQGFTAIQAMWMSEISLPAERRTRRNRFSEDSFLSVAEEKAAAIHDSWDPVKQKLRELDAKQTLQDSEAVTVNAALERWVKTIRGSRDNDNTFAKYQTMAKQIAAWTRHIGLAKLHEISADHLDEWITSWSPKAKRDLEIVLAKRPRAAA
jgi:hypothetical protein